MFPSYNKLKPEIRIMTEDDRKRLKAVEDNVFELKGISQSLKQLVEKDVEHIKEDMSDIKDDVAMLKKHDEEFTKAMYESCDAKTKEINMTVDEEIAKALVPIKETATQNRRALYGLFALFVASLAWLTLQDAILRDARLAEDGRIHEKMNKHIEKSATQEGSHSATLNEIFKDIREIKEALRK